MVLLYYYYCKKKRGINVVHTHAITSGQGWFRWRHFRHFRWKGPTKWVLLNFRLRMRIPYFRFRTCPLPATQLPVTWILVTSGQACAMVKPPSIPHKCDFVRTHILLICTYNCPLSIGTLMKEGVNQNVVWACLPFIGQGSNTWSLTISGTYGIW
jgi:hypothetical protein